MTSIESLLVKPDFESLRTMDSNEVQGQILNILETRYAKSSANTSAAGYLWATGCPLFYPYGEKAENYDLVSSGDPLLADPEILAYLIDQYNLDKNNSRLGRLTATAVQKAISMHLTPYDGQIAKDREQQDGFWKREIAPLENGEEILDKVTQQNGDTMWIQYMTIRNMVTSGSLPPELTVEYVKIFDSVERAAGKQEAEQLVRAIRKMKELGFDSLDRYFELILGEPVESVQAKAQNILDAFGNAIDRSQVPEEYFRYFNRLMVGYEGDAVSPDPEADIMKQLREMGISEEEWNAQVIMCKDGNPNIPTAYCYFISGTPDFPQVHGLDPEQVEWKNKFVWEKILKGANAGIALRGGNIDTAEQERLLYHEDGHAIEALLRGNMDQLEGRTPGISLIGRPITLNEVFSLLNESLMPSMRFFNRKESFLTHRYAALLLHEINMWRMAENVTNETEMDAFLKSAELSYQQVMGDSLHLRVSTGRALRDFFDPATPFIAASYAFGMPLALSIRKSLGDLQAPNARRALLEKVSEATAKGQNIEAVLSSIDISWDQATGRLSELKEV